MSKGQDASLVPTKISEVSHGYVVKPFRSYHDPVFRSSAGGVAVFQQLDDPESGFPTHCQEL